ncbi:MAG: cyanophycinase [Kiloniellales bacterium]|nr:cyanophycinase [Kiloniellales bacterium]
MLSRLGFAVAMVLVATSARADGRLFIVGGNAQSDILFDRFVEISGGSDAKICIFGTNSSDPQDSRDFYAGLFEDRGAQTFPVEVTMQNSAWNTVPFEDDFFTFDDPAQEVRETEERLTEDPATVALVKGCNAVWFGGGNQNRGTFALLNQDGSDTPVMAAIRRIVAGGGAFGGTSAGAAVQSDPMIVNGTSIDSLSLPPGPLRVGTSNGFGLLPPGFLADQHFLVWGRLGRLLVAMADNGIPQAVGVNEDTAVEVDLDSGIWEVVGTSQALIVELEDPDDPKAAIVHLLGHGDRYDTKTRQVTFNRALSDITDDPFLPQAPIFKLGVFNADVIPEIITLAVDTIGETSGVGIDFLGSDDPSYSVYGVQLRFAQTETTAAYLCFRSCRGDNPNRSGSLARYSVSNMRATVETLAIAVTEVDKPETARGRIRAIKDLIKAALGLPKP